MIVRPRYSIIILVVVFIKRPTMNCDGDVEGKYVQWLDRQTFEFVQATGQGAFKNMVFYFDENDRKTEAVGKFFRNAQLGGIYVFSNCLDRTADVTGMC